MRRLSPAEIGGLIIVVVLILLCCAGVGVLAVFTTPGGSYQGPPTGASGASGA